MFANEPTQEPSAIGFLLLPRFSLMSLLSAIEPLRGANRTLGRTAYAWEFFSLDGAPVESSSDIPIAPHRAIGEVRHCPTVFVLASYAPLAAVTRELTGWLRRRHRTGSTLVGVESGPDTIGFGV